MAIFNTTQVPIQEPMYINRQLSQAWLMFFLRLSQVAAVDDQTDLAEITQLAHQAPTQATQGQMLIDMGVLKESPPLMQQQAHQKEILQPLQAVFLLPEFHAPLAIVPSSEIIHDSI